MDTNGRERTYIAGCIAFIAATVICLFTGKAWLGTAVLLGSVFCAYYFGRTVQRGKGQGAIPSID